MKLLNLYLSYLRSCDSLVKFPQTGRGETKSPFFKKGDKRTQDQSGSSLYPAT